MTLNFALWNGSSFNGQKGNWFVETLKYLVQLLPPIYVLTCIPINCLTLANNIKAFLPDTKKNVIWINVLLNFVSVLPALAFSFAFKSLGIIIQFTGLAGFVLLSMPSLLLWKSRRLCKLEFLTTVSSYSGFLDHDYIIYAIVAFYIVGFVLTIWSLVDSII